MWFGGRVVRNILACRKKGPVRPPWRLLADLDLPVLFGDGSVHFTKNSIDDSTWAAAGTRAGGEANAFPF
jgi:hypothetical protein